MQGIFSTVDEEKSDLAASGFENWVLLDEAGVMVDKRLPGVNMISVITWDTGDDVITP